METSWEVRVARKSKSETSNRKMPLLRGLATVMLPLLGANPALAFEIDAGNPDVHVSWDNTVKYSAAFRAAAQSDTLINSANPNLDDGDRNFGKGMISNRVDLLSELDVIYKNFGARVSGAAWYDSVYNRGTSNNSPFTYNPLSVPNTQFTKGTRDLQGRKAEVLDAFVFGKGQFGETTGSFRLGRHSLLWGESLFFGDNGIAGTQAPIDIVKLLSVPNTQFKELIRPTGQLSGALQITPTITIGAYYQYEWEKNRIPASGSYFSRADLFDEGGERLIAGAPGGPFAGAPAFFRGVDQKPKDPEFGVQLRWRSEALNTDFGFYATRFDDKNFQVYVRPSAGLPNFATGQIGTYNLVYAQGIRAFGASFSKSVGSVNIGGEVSTRRNTPLVATGGIIAVLPGQVADNNDNPLYPVGNSLHAQLSMIHTLERNALWDGGLLLGEVAWNRRLSISKNAAALDPNTTRDAAALRMVLSPTYYQALPGLDLSVPVGLGYNFSGRSSVITLWNGGSSKGGDFSIGLAGDYLQTWKLSLTYTQFFGSSGPVVDKNNNYSFKQSLKDRNFISLSASRTF